MRGTDREVKGCTDRRLVEAREKAVGEEWLEVGVNVDFGVLWILVEVEACRVGDIRVLEMAFESILTGNQVRKVDTMSFELDLWVMLTVERYFGDLLPLKIYKEFLRCRILRIESYFCRSRKTILKFLVQTHYHCIVYLVNDSVPQRCFLLIKSQIFFLKITID